MLLLHESNFSIPLDFLAYTRITKSNKYENYFYLCQTLVQFLQLVPHIQRMKYIRISSGYTSIHNMLSKLHMYAIPNCFRIDGEASVIISLNVRRGNKKSIAFIKAFLSILGDCNSTCRLSIVSVCKTVQLSTSMTEYVQNLAEFPGESHLPSPASTNSLYLNLESKSSYNSHTYLLSN